MITANTPTSESYELLGKLVREGSKGRDTLNNFIKRVRSGQLVVDELVGSIYAFEGIIYWEEKVSPAWGGLLSNLFAQLEANWRGVAFNTDIRAVQLVLLRRLLLLRDEGRVSQGNLVIWTAALKEIRYLSGQAREMAVEWVLKRCKSEAEESDWPVIFHNLIGMSHGTSALLLRIFEGICGCSSRALMDHLIFLIGQNGRLGRAWIKWVMGRGCLGIDALMFSGVLSLSQDMEYYALLRNFTINVVKSMSEIHDLTGKSIDPNIFLSSVVQLIRSDDENGLKGAMELMVNLKTVKVELSEKFFLELYKAHPFARRELLRQVESCENWKSVYEIDSIIFKEHFRSNLRKLKTPELVSRIIDHEDELEDVNCSVLLEIDSVLVDKALALDNNWIVPRKTCVIEFCDWKEIVSIAQISVLKLQVNKEEMAAKFVELCDLLLLPNEICEGMVELAIEFVCQADGIYSRKEKMRMISKLIASNNTNLPVSACSYENVLRVFDDWSAFEGTLKFLLERISLASEEFYAILAQVPVGVEFQNLVAKAIGRIEKVELRESVIGVIGGIAGRVVSEPQLSKALTTLLSRKYEGKASKALLNKFTEISDPGMIKLVCEWGLVHGIEGMREEMMKSILIYYGVIESESEDSSSLLSKDKLSSKFKNIHLNEKSVSHVLTIILNECQVNLANAHKFVRECLMVDAEGFFARLTVVVEVLVALTRGLITGKGALKLHSLLTSFYNLCTKLLVSAKLSKVSEGLKELTRIVGGQLNKQVYALIPLQQEKIQTILKQELNLKKTATRTSSGSGNIGKSVTGLVYEMERFEEALIGVLRERPQGEKGWCEKIVRSTARDFKIKLEQL